MQYSAIRYVTVIWYVHYIVSSIARLLQRKGGIKTESYATGTGGHFVSACVNMGC